MADKYDMLCEVLGEIEKDAAQPYVYHYQAACARCGIPLFVEVV